MSWNYINQTLQQEKSRLWRWPFKLLSILSSFFPSFFLGGFGSTLYLHILHENNPSSQYIINKATSLFQTTFEKPKVCRSSVHFMTWLAGAEKLSLQCNNWSSATQLLPEAKGVHMAPVDGSMLCRKQIYRILQVFKKADLCSMYWAVQWSWFAWVNAFCNLSHKKLQKVAVSLQGWFLSRRCFTLCITMEVESRIAKQYKCHHCCSCKKTTGERGWRVGKSVCVNIWLTKRSWVCEKKCFRASYSMSNKLLRVARHILTTSLQKCLSSWQCKIRKFTVTTFHWKKVCTRSKSSQGT